MAERLTVVDSADARRPSDRCRQPRGRRPQGGLDAYDRGDFFEAHELLEPAWMGTDDPGERAFFQGLIKLAAAYVHDVRGNPGGHRQEPDRRAGLAGRGDRDAGRRRAGLDLDVLVADDRRSAGGPCGPSDGATLGPPVLHRSEP